MNRSVLLVVALVGAALVPTLAMGHPPGADPHNSCYVKKGEMGPFTPPVAVQGTVSYVDALWTTPLNCDPAVDQGEWGSHADACPAPPFTGPMFGVYCGPVVAPGAAWTCTWSPVWNEVPTELVIGYDIKPYSGWVNLAIEGERPVFGPFPPGSWTTWNPYPAYARIMAFPTNVAPPGDPLHGVMAPGDVNDVVC